MASTVSICGITVLLSWKPFRVRWYRLLVKIARVLPTVVPLGNERNISISGRARAESDQSVAIRALCQAQTSPGISISRGYNVKKKRINLEIQQSVENDLDISFC